MKKTSTLVAAALAGLAQAKGKVTNSHGLSLSSSDNSCNSKGGCGSKQMSCNGKT